jgi:hypothetical protein
MWIKGFRAWIPTTEVLRCISEAFAYSARVEKSTVIVTDLFKKPNARRLYEEARYSCLLMIFPGVTSGHWKKYEIEVRSN